MARSYLMTNPVLQLMNGFAIALLFGATGLQANGPQRSLATTPPEAITQSAETLQSVVDRYCIGCHNQTAKTAGLMLDAVDPRDVSTDALIWEKVIRKLRAGTMPPAGRPRPNQSSSEAVVRFLETELDLAAAKNPNPGQLPLFHRLSRTEYQNAVRDLLGLDALPKEMDLTLLLPADNASSSFDNIADLLFVSPTTMEAYLEAARKISRLAVGDPTIPLIVDTHLLPTDSRQDIRVAGLPFGTRGGTVLKTYLPLDGEYEIKVEFSGIRTQEHQLEITANGERLKLFTVAQKPAEEEDSVAEVSELTNADQVEAHEFIDKDLETRVALEAGPKEIGITFLQHSAARDETFLLPSLRTRGPLPSVARITVSGPYDGQVPRETPARRRIFSCYPTRSSEEKPCAKEILLSLAVRAYRGEVTDSDMEDLLPFFNAGRLEGGFDMGIQSALERLLVSPQFLFRIERVPVDMGKRKVFRINSHELASRLSFFLWSSIPDQELLDVAKSGTLAKPAVLEHQVRRMLLDSRSASLVTNFAAQWLYLRDIETKRPDELLFPDFDESLRQALSKETELFLESIIREERSVLELLTADYTFVNERLAKHYGIPKVKGPRFRRIIFGEDEFRGGLLSHGSILTLTSYATRTSPVLRGKWILENILASPPPPPPPNVPTLRTESSDSGEALSMRQAMVQHRANPVCATCHARMDPLGFALENFDAVGKWRDINEAGERVDASATLDGVEFDGMAGLKKILLSHPEEFVSSVTEKLLKYAVGRDLQYYDTPTVRGIVRDSVASNYTFESLVLGVVKSVPFQMRSQNELSQVN